MREVLSDIITPGPEASKLVMLLAIFFQLLRVPAVTAAPEDQADKVVSPDQALPAARVEAQTQALEALPEALLTREVLRDSITVPLMVAPLFLSLFAMLSVALPQPVLKAAREVQAVTAEPVETAQAREMAEREA